MKSHSSTFPVWVCLTLLLNTCPSEYCRGQESQFVIETDRYRAEFDGALIVSFRNKLVAGEPEMMDAPPSSTWFPYLRMGTPSNDDLGQAANSPSSVVRNGEGYIVTYFQETPLKEYNLHIRVDPETQDLVMQTSARTSLPAYFRWIWMTPDSRQGRVLMPIWGGVSIPPNAPDILQNQAGQSRWNLGTPVAVYERTNHTGGFCFWVQSGDLEKFAMISYANNGFSSEGGRLLSLAERDWHRPAMGEPGVEVRLNTYRGNWSHGIALVRDRRFHPVAPGPPEWMKEIRLVYNVPHLRAPNAKTRVPEILALNDEVNATFPRANPLRPANILLYHNAWAADDHDQNYPDYAMGPRPGFPDVAPYETFVREAHSAGFPIMPHFNANMISRYLTDQVTGEILGDHWAWLAFGDRVFQEWNGTEIVNDKNGTSEARVHHAISLGHDDIREAIRNRILTVASNVNAEIVFLDVTGNSWNPADINPLNFPGTGFNFMGLQKLIQEIRGQGFEIAGELTSWQTANAGQWMTQVFPMGEKNKPYEPYYKHGSAIGGCLSHGVQRLFGHLAMPSPDSHPVDNATFPDGDHRSFFQQYIAAFFQGALINLRWPAATWGDSTESVFDHRGKKWATERSLYAHNHLVELFPDPTPEWDRDDVLIIETVDGIQVPRTEQWLINMLVCDWHWIYGGRAPTPQEFESTRAGLRLADGSLIAAMEQIIQQFVASPPLPDDIEPRGLALAKINRLFPEYPLVSRWVRWNDDFVAYLSPNGDVEVGLDLKIDVSRMSEDQIDVSLVDRGFDSVSIDTSGDLLNWFPEPITDVTTTNYSLPVAGKSRLFIRGKGALNLP